MRGGGGSYLAFPPKNAVLCGLSAPRRKATSLPSSPGALAAMPASLLAADGRIAHAGQDSRQRLHFPFAVNAREVPSPSSFDRPLNGTEGASLLVSTQGTTSSEGERSSFGAAAVKAVKAASLNAQTAQ